MVKERNVVRTGQEHDEKTQTENNVYSSVMKPGDQSDLDEDLGSLSIDDIINHIEQLKIKDEKKEIFTARGKIKTPQIDERLYPYGHYHKTPDNVQISLPGYNIVQPYLNHDTIIPPSFQQVSVQNPFRGKHDNYVAAVDERCRFWMKPYEELEYYQQKQFLLFPRKDPHHGRWVEDGRVRKQKMSGDPKSTGKVALSIKKKPKQTKDLTVADGAVIPFPEEFCSDEDIIDGLPFDLDVDCCPGQMHFSEKAWEDGIPKLDLPARDLMDIFENGPDSHIMSKSEHRGYSPMSPSETISNYHPSPVRMDEVYNQDSNDKLSSPEQSQDECEIIDTTSSYPHMGLSPKSSSTLANIEVCSPSELSPGELKNLEQITQHINDTYTILDNNMYFDWISCDIDGDSVLHSCMIADINTDFTLLLINTLHSEGILSSIVNLQNQMLRTALFLAVLEKKVDIVKSLLDNNADPNIQGKVVGINDNYELRSPLHLVAEQGDSSLEMLKILLCCHKTQVDLRSESDRRTALHLALLSHCLDRPEESKVNCSRTIELLIQYDADVEMAEDCSSKTPIIMAIDTRDYHLVKSFINCVEEEKEKDMIRCILETCTRAGDTPLHIAAGANILKEDKVKLLRLLVNRGANTHTENNIKQLPEDIASRDLWKAAFRC